MKTFSLSLIMVFLLSSYAFAASEILLESRCGNNSIPEYRITYTNNSLPSGTHVFVETAFQVHYDSGEGGFPGQTVEWKYPKMESAVQLPGSSSWVIAFINRGFDTNGIIDGNAIPVPEFVFKIQLPNGETYYDNGGSAYGHYQMWMAASNDGDCSIYHRERVLVIK